MPRTRTIRALTLDQKEDLLHHLEERLDGPDGLDCDGTMRHVEAFLGSRGWDVPGTLEWLRTLGAWCDCEVWMNVR